MQYVYYYQAVSGYHMPDFFTGELDNLNKNFEKSVTPIVRIIPLTSPEVRRAITECLEAQLIATKLTETGLRYSLKQTIKKLKGDHTP